MSRSWRGWRRHSRLEGSKGASAALAEFGLLLTGEGGDMSEFFKVSESGRVMGLNMIAIQESVSAAAEKRVADAEMPTCRQVDR